MMGNSKICACYFPEINSWMVYTISHSRLQILTSFYDYNLQKFFTEFSHEGIYL
jgi:hypothetical protein